jgi:hypothetical protein
MSTGPQDAGTSTARQGKREGDAPRAGSGADDRADIEEDRRRQRDLDDGELGGEA